MSSQASTDRLLGDVEINPDIEEYGTSMHIRHHPDTVLGGSERRRQVEKKLLRKLDYRLTFLLLVYIMNCVSFLSSFSHISGNLTGNLRWTGVIYRKACHSYFSTCLSSNMSGSTARLKGLEEDLHLTGLQFNTLISILHVGYVLMQVPSCVAAPLDNRDTYKFAETYSSIGLKTIRILLSAFFCGVSFPSVQVSRHLRRKALVVATQLSDRCRH